MIITPFGQRLKNYFRSNKTYDCTVSIKHINLELINVTVKGVKAKSKSDAELEAKKAVLDNLKIETSSVKSNGTIKKFVQ